VTEGQYIVELICEKRAQYLERDLPIKFWELPEWAKFFRSQTQPCHSLLAKYHGTAIISALKDKRTRSIYSLRAKWLIPIIEEYDKKIIFHKKDKRQTISPINSDDYSTRQSQKKINIIDKLKDIDNG